MYMGYFQGFYLTTNEGQVEHLLNILEIRENDFSKSDNYTCNCKR